jgi:hypothetical protein
MSAEVEISVGNRRGVLSVPNEALRTERDYASAAGVLGMDPDVVRSELSQTTAATASSGGVSESSNDRVTDGSGFAARSPADPGRAQMGGFMGPPVNISNDLVGGDFIVFTMQNGEIGAARIRTGLTDLNYSEVVSGLTASDTVVVLQSAGSSAGGGGPPGPPPGR